MDLYEPSGPARKAGPPFDDLGAMMRAFDDINCLFYVNNPKGLLRMMLYVVFADGKVLPVHPYMGIGKEDKDGFAKQMKRLCEEGKIIRYVLFHEVCITSTEHERKDVVVTLGFERGHAPLCSALEIIRDEPTGHVVRLDAMEGVVEVEASRFDFFS